METDLLPESRSDARSRLPRPHPTEGTSHPLLLHASTEFRERQHQIWNRGGASPQNTEKGSKKREGEERRGEKEESSNGRGRTGAEEAADHPTRSATREKRVFSHICTLSCDITAII
ncbi:unnamed protein product [Brassica napus]|uniref:(rape) hypothetical protein n=1 Tax=Brassica napus TaxID=3708 RepID=A0A816K1F0_BRANA|nr:unnamed protein product [Brassica napus]